MPILTDAEYDADLQLTLDDSGVSITVVYAGVQTFVPATGVATKATTSEVLTALVETLSRREVQESHGRYEFGDRRFIWRVVDAAQAPDENDWITEDLITHRMISVALDPSKRSYWVVARENA